jgi:protein-ribulosamine 3-kinase
VELYKFCARAAELHAASAEAREMGLSVPIGGKYGLHVTTHLGMLPQDTHWCNSWEQYYIQDMLRILAFEEKTQGPSDELDKLASGLIERVIPRLLRPLECDGRSIKPMLVYGDLQERNAKTDLATQNPVIFDAGSFWGYNECECRSICFFSHRPVVWLCGC